MTMVHHHPRYLASCTPAIPSTPSRSLPHHLLSHALWLLIASLALAESLLWLLKSIAEALLSILQTHSAAAPAPVVGASPFSALHAYPPPPPSSKPYTLVLDLDETLVHASPAFSPSADLRIEILSKRHPKVLYVSKRPFIDVFLQVASRYFQIVVYTAGVRRYADAVLDSIDRHGVISKRFCRETCDVLDSAGGTKEQPEFTVVKDLTKVSKDLATTVFIDNSPEAYLAHRANGIAIAPWFDDPKDQELLRILPFLVALRNVKDVRTVLGRTASKGFGLKVEEKFKVT